MQRMLPLEEHEYIRLSAELPADISWSVALSKQIHTEDVFLLRYYHLLLAFRCNGELFSHRVVDRFINELCCIKFRLFFVYIILHDSLLVCFTLFRRLRDWERSGALNW